MYNTRLPISFLVALKSRAFKVIQISRLHFFLFFLLKLFKRDQTTSLLTLCRRSQLKGVSYMEITTKGSLVYGNHKIQACIFFFLAFFLSLPFSIFLVAASIAMSVFSLSLSFSYSMVCCPSALVSGINYSDSQPGWLLRAKSRQEPLPNRNI